MILSERNQQFGRSELDSSFLGKSGTSGFETRNFRVCPENPNYEHHQNRPWKHDSIARDIIYSLNVGVLPRESNRSILGKEIGQKE